VSQSKYILKIIKTEYFNRAYHQLTLHTSESWVFIDVDDGEGDCLTLFGGHSEQEIKSYGQNNLPRKREVERSETGAFIIGEEVT